MAELCYSVKKNIARLNSREITSPYFRMTYLTTVLDHSISELVVSSGVKFGV